MAPKVKTTREEIISKTLELVRRDGERAINARTIASAIGCSTQPIFSNFKNMSELRKEIVVHGYRIYLSRLETEAKGNEYPKYKSFGMTYIKFAVEERELFKLLFMRDRNGEEMAPTADFEESVKIIMDANGISRESAERMHLEMWTCVHGIATMLATSFLSFEWDAVSAMISDVYRGLREIHVKESVK